MVTAFLSSCDTHLRSNFFIVDIGATIRALNALADVLPNDPPSAPPFIQEVSSEVNHLGQGLVNFIDKEGYLQISIKLIC